MTFNRVCSDGRFSLEFKGGLLDGIIIDGDRNGNYLRFMQTLASDTPANVECRLTKSAGALIPVIVTITTIRPGQALVLSDRDPERIFWRAVDNIKDLECLFESPVDSIRPLDPTCTCRCPTVEDCHYLTRRVQRIGLAMAKAPTNSILLLTGAGISQTSFSKVLCH